MQSWGSGEEYICLEIDHRNRKWKWYQIVNNALDLENACSKILSQNKGVTAHTVDMDFKKVKEIWILKSCYNMCEKEMDRDAKSILARAKDGWPLKKLTWESCWGKRPLLTFSWCHQEIDGRKSPKHSWKWNLNPKTETFLFLFKLSQIISHENRNIYLFWCWLSVPAWKEPDEDERLDILVCTVLQQRLW